jgi:hypothetical protein
MHQHRDHREKVKRDRPKGVGAHGVDEENGVPEAMKKVATVKRRRPTMRPTRGIAVVGRARQVYGGEN